MLAFEISINGVKKCTAGIETDGCITAILAWLQHQPARNTQDNCLTFDVGSLQRIDEADVYGRWLNEILTVGDSLTIRIVEVSVSDASIIHEHASPRDRERSERQYYERLKQKYRKVNRRRKKTAP